MKNWKKKMLWEIAFWVVLLLGIASIFFFVGRTKDVDLEDVECIGNNSILYVQEGCIHCETQIKLFGDYIDEIQVIDCFYNRDLCWNENLQISATPSWSIDGKLYQGLKSIEELKKLVNC